MLPKLFNMKKSSKSYEKDSSSSDLGDFEEFTGTVGYDATYQGYDKTYTPTEYVKGIKIERKLYDDDLYNIMNKKPKQLGYSAVRTREKLGAQIFNEAFTTAPADGDAVALCSASHPSPSGGSVQSNTGTTAISATAVEATRRLMVAYRGMNQEIISINPNLLLVPIACEETAYEIINSKGKIDSDANNVNFHEGKYKLAIWKNFLTDSNNWFMIDDSLMKDYLMWFDRIPVEFFQDKDSDTLLAKYCAYMRFSRGWSDWRWIYGQLVS
jgi:phage major head subunit gpT-like protein